MLKAFRLESIPVKFKHCIICSLSINNCYFAIDARWKLEQVHFSLATRIRCVDLLNLQLQL